MLKDFSIRTHSTHCKISEILISLISYSTKVSKFLIQSCPAGAKNLINYSMVLSKILKFALIVYAKYN